MPKVRIENHDGRLRLRWSFLGKAYTMACGVPDTPVGRALATQLKGSIELDLQAGYFDQSLLKYRPRTLGDNRTELTTVQLFDKYTQHRKRTKELSANGLQKYKALRSHLEAHFGLKTKAEQVGDRKAREFVDYLLEFMETGTARQYLFLMRGCWQWALGKYHISSEPWSACIEKIEPHEAKRVKPFTEAEIKAIQAGFESSESYCHYYPVVKFLFATAVRPGEAFGLRWLSVSDDFSYVVIREAVSRGKKRDRTKTNKNRFVYLSPAIAEMLQKMHQKNNPEKDALVFPSPKGMALSDHNFNRRAWRSVLASVGVEYRGVYAIRHSAISHALINGANPVDLAEQTGHRPRTMLDIYAHAVGKKSLFKEF